jgi:uncharacterized protein (TIGR00299 family) protein
MIRTLYLNCFSGVAGDMTLAALLDVGAPLDGVRELLAGLNLAGWNLTAEPVTRSGIGATLVKVEVEGDSTPRPYSAIVDLLAGATLPERVRHRALKAFSMLAEAEARVHRVPVADVHFHEVGGHDALIDIVGVMCALELLAVERVVVSPVAIGQDRPGSSTPVAGACHSGLPRPAPAVAQLLLGAPTYGIAVDAETVTPTGAALVRSLASDFGCLPTMSWEAVGYGAGHREFSWLPNCVQALVGEVGVPGNRAGHRTLLVQTNLDDVTGEVLGEALPALLSAGAVDAWISPVVMKKGRPGFVLSALVDPAAETAVGEALVRATGVPGYRVLDSYRQLGERHTDKVQFGRHELRVKVGPGRAKVEHADAVQASLATGIPLLEVLARAEAAWRARYGSGS